MLSLVGSEGLSISENVSWGDYSAQSQELLTLLSKPTVMKCLLKEDWATGVFIPSFNAEERTLKKANNRLETKVLGSA